MGGVRLIVIVFLWVALLSVIRGCLGVLLFLVILAWYSGSLGCGICAGDGRCGMT